MRRSDFEALLGELQTEELEINRSKGKEYAQGDADALRNFKVIAGLFGDEPVVITPQVVCMIYTLKHVLSLGTDTDNPYLVPGISLHDELEYLAQAGFTPYEAIETGTRNAAEALGRVDEFGTVAEGKRADLILVEENPLADVTNVGKRAGVMLRGIWLPEAQQGGMLK